jgi:glycosyltransferase involved in cell wall biosynthesis
MQSKKPIIFVLVRYYLPGYKSGGPVRAIANMVDCLGDDFDFRIVTSDRDHLDNTPYLGIDTESWNRVGKAQVYYLSPRDQFMGKIVKILSEAEYDIIYLNSFFDPIFTIQVVLARRFGLLANKTIMVAPRGEFSPGALAIKHLKKAIFIKLSIIFRLYQGLIWHVSSEHESRHVQESMGALCNERFNNDQIILPDLASSSHLIKSEQNSRTRQDRSPLRITFLSRIVPVKNLDFALRVLARLTIPIQFHIYGPKESMSYWNKCEALITNAPPNVSVHYHGPVVYSQVIDVLADCDLFFLPTRGENYGHVIVEALSAGTPILIANTTPWRNLESKGVGWDLPLNSEAEFARKIYSVYSMTKDAYILLRERAHNYGHQLVSDSQIVASYRQMFRGILDRPPTTLIRRRT